MKPSTDMSKSEKSQGGVQAGRFPPRTAPSASTTVDEQIVRKRTCDLPGHLRAGNNSGGVFGELMACTSRVIRQRGIPSVVKNGTFSHKPLVKVFPVTERRCP